MHAKNLNIKEVLIGQMGGENIPLQGAWKIDEDYVSDTIAISYDADADKTFMPNQEYEIFIRYEGSIRGGIF